jgi:hypothetical protein
MAAPTVVDVRAVGQENLALRSLVAVYRHLSSLAVQNVGVGAVAELIAERVDTMVAVVDEKLAVLAAASPDRQVDAAVFFNERVAHPRLAQVLGVAGHTRRALRIPDVAHATPMIVAPILVGDDVPAYLMTVDDGEQDTGEDLRLLLTEHAATICGVILGRERVVAAAATQVRYDLVEGLLPGRGRDTEEVRRWAAHLGYDEDREHRVLSFVLDGGHEASDFARRVTAAVERFFTSQAPEAITAVRGREVAVVLLEFEPASHRARKLAASCLERTKELFRDAVVTAGIGGPCCQALDIAHSYDDARRAVQVGERMGRVGTVVAFDDLGIHRLLQLTEPAQLRQFVSEVFGDLAQHTGGNAADCLTTLACYFRANNSPQRASRTLHVHPNTVTYRIRRGEEQTGLDFASYRDRLMAQVALEIMDAVGEA